MAKITPSERALIGRIGAYTAYPDTIPESSPRLADEQKAYFARLALLSAKARRRRTS